MTDQIEPNTIDATGEAESPPALLPISSDECADLISQAERVFSYALREEGLHLWEMRFFDTSVARPLERLLASDIEDSLRELVASVLTQVQESAALVWYERIDPLRAAHSQLAGQTELQAPATAELKARAEVVLTEQFAGPNKKTERDERGPRAVWD